MPRLLQRLVNQLSAPKFRQVDRRIPYAPGSRGRRRPKSLFKPLPPEPSWSPSDRTQSIILDDLNPVIHRKIYEVHKTLPPRLRVSPRQGATTDEYDRPREMTAQERAWWSSPYLRMLATPIRFCTMTSRYLPQDFMIRVATFRLPSHRGSQITILPDGLEHPKFRGRRSGEGHYIVCWNEVADAAVQKGIKQRYSRGAIIHSLLTAQIGHLLRLRVLQELHILAETLLHHQQDAQESPILRRLTRAEFKTMTSTGVVPYPGVIAVLVVPPVNKHPVTKRRPEPASAFDSVPSANEEVKPPLRPPLPLSKLLKTSEGDAGVECLGTLPSVQPQEKVPLYNGATMFPSRPQRAALHALLNKILRIERRARRRQHDPSVANANHIEDEKEDRRGQGDQKASHAFLLFSDSQTVLRGDTVGVAVALLRIRMWEGTGWEEGTNQEGGWLWRAYKRKGARL